MRYIHRNEWVVYGLLAVAVLVVSLPLYPYRWHMFLHIAGVVVFLGNIIVTAAWMLMAERTRSLMVIHFSAKAVIRADLLFTLPGVLLILMNGFAMGRSEGVSRTLVDNCRSSSVYRVGDPLVGSAHSGPTSHGGVLRPVGLHGLTGSSVLLSPPQVVLLGWSGDCPAHSVAVPHGQQARLRLEHSREVHTPLVGGCRQETLIPTMQ